MVKLQRRVSSVLSVPALMLLACPAGRASPIQGQVDTFQGGSTNNWANGHGVPVISTTGGPGAANGPYMQMTATGGTGADSKMTLFNQSQWTGNYSAAGVAGITMDLKDLSGTSLTLRVALKTATGNSPGWVSLTGFALPNDNAWHHVTFPLDAADLTPVNSPPPLATVLTNVVELRFLESASPAVEGDVIAASVGATNITAVPEPALALPGATAGLLLARRRRRGA